MLPINGVAKKLHFFIFYAGFYFFVHTLKLIKKIQFHLDLGEQTTFFFLLRFSPYSVCDFFIIIFFTFLVILLRRIPAKNFLHCFLNLVQHLLKKSFQDIFDTVF